MADENKSIGPVRSFRLTGTPSDCHYVGIFQGPGYRPRFPSPETGLVLDDPIADVCATRERNDVIASFKCLDGFGPIHVILP